MKKMRRAIISFLLVGVLAALSVLTIGAVNATNSGTKTNGNSFISWTFKSVGSSNTMTSCQFTKLLPSTGVSVTDQHRIGSDTSEAYGKVKATLYGSTWLPTGTILTWHTIHNNAITVHVPLS